VDRQDLIVDVDTRLVPGRPAENLRDDQTAGVITRGRTEPCLPRLVRGRRSARRETQPERVERLLIIQLPRALDDGLPEGAEIQPRHVFGDLAELLGRVTARS